MIGNRIYARRIPAKVISFDEKYCQSPYLYFDSDHQPLKIRDIDFAWMMMLFPEMEFIFETKASYELSLIEQAKERRRAGAIKGAATRKRNQLKKQ